MTAVADVQFTDRHAFERNVLYAIRTLERDRRTARSSTNGSEANYAEAVNESRLYQNL